MATATQTRGHSHHHHHHHDNAYLLSQNKNDAGVRITRIGLFSNLGMAVAKGVGGLYFGSQAMVADAVHSCTDLASDVLTLLTVSWSLRPPTDRYPTGFGKIESLGSLGVSGLLLCGGLYMCWGSLGSLSHILLSPEWSEWLSHWVGLGDDHGHGHGHSHSHSHLDASIPSLHAAWLAAGTIAIKEWLYFATMKVARERKSSVLASNAIHHRVDSWTGGVTLAVILAANFIQSAAWLDPLGGLAISAMVIQAGIQNTMSALTELADRSIDDEVKKSVRRQAGKAVQTVSEGHDAELREVSGLKSGQNYLIDLEFGVPGAWTVEDCRDLEDAVRTQVGGKVRGVRRVRVRFVPSDTESSPKFDEFIPGDVSPRESPEPEEDEHHHGHDHSHDHDHDHKSNKSH